MTNGLVGPWLKTAGTLLLTTFTVPAINSLCARVLPEQLDPALLDYFAWGNLLTRQNIGEFSWDNVLVFALLLASAALLVVGAVMEWRRRKPSSTQKTDIRMKMRMSVLFSPHSMV